MEQLRFETFEQAKEYFRPLAYDYFGRYLSITKGVFWNNISEKNLQELKDLEQQLVDLKNQRMLLFHHTKRFYDKYNFEILEQTRTHIPFSLVDFINELLDKVRDKIYDIEQFSKVMSIKELVNKLQETEIKEKLTSEIEDLEAVKKEQELSKLSEKDKFQEEIELGKHRAEMFAKRTDTFLKFLNRESIASIVGSLLLFIMGICLLVMMFLQKEPIKIIESAFLLILGYFFGHSKKTDNN